ncbi:carboxyl transferase domain-containing protein [Hydrogenophaga sp.]|uniref:carboxyl transferase domain-containing protein n=1 Tax=Hydrogenophaga sp. TaxID=1904254 RepID=UPI0027325C58|nr:carboxyl transferase domain-containing protein [Hydrogenophaga sp.]MDP3806146.1 carboxyl transferase domain-containing protein [Hydrogenophaga sp.]
MTFKKLLIANRGEIAVRLVRAAADMGMATVAVHAADEARSLHVRMADEAVALQASGPAAYLDIEAVVQAGLSLGCDAVHPGYGFLSESAAFAERVGQAGMRFVGPRPALLDLFGDKAKAIDLARRCGVPVIAGTGGATTLEQAHAFMATLPPGEAVMVKAIAGGGGCGMRAVHQAGELEEAFQRCRSEALNAFGNGDLYVERFLPRARHIEIQVVGDGQRVVHLGERECSVQRRNQKIVEIAPSPSLPAALREQLFAAALRMATEVQYEGLGTFEFLVACDAQGATTDFSFIEVNPRLQVEHTVTEAVTGLDLVKTQLRIAMGMDLPSLGLLEPPVPRGHAIELRINMETVNADGSTRPSGGVLTAFDLPSGPGVRVDTFGYTGYATSSRYDSLLAKLIVHVPTGDYADAVHSAYRALSEFRIEGLATNIPLFRAMLRTPDFIANHVYTRYLDQQLPRLLAEDTAPHRERFFNDVAAAPRKERGSRSADPLAVFSDREGVSPTHAAGTPRASEAAPDGALAIQAPQQGTVIALEVVDGDVVRTGQVLLVMEAMKMEHAIVAPQAGTVTGLAIALSETVFEGEVLAYLLPGDAQGETLDAVEEIDLDAIRPDLAEVLQRRAGLLDAQRPDAVARRRKTGQRTTRENIADLCDAESFVEYGGLAVAAQRSRHSVEELIRLSPADGMVVGLGRINGEHFSPERARCAVLSYDYTVFAGTQGVVNHKKTDRLLHLAQQWRLPVIIFAEGGGGRPGDDWPTPAGLDTDTFTLLGALSGLVPTIGIASGRCFAGNAALLGACNVIIATENSNIGMGGPAMIEGGGLGVFKPEQVGPMSVQVPNGVVDLLVRDEAEAVATAKRYLSYFQGPLAEWTAADQRLLRNAVPDNRLRAYDIRQVIRTLADEGSVLELRPQHGVGMITALIRIEGQALGVIANNPQHLAGAIDNEAGDKAARMIQLCDAFDLPLLSLCDTPGMMVGPQIEEQAQVRHVSRMFLAAANADVPMFTVVLRKGYGLGALAMAGGSSRSSMRMVSWPTGEFGPMGLEGGVKLAYRKEMQAIEDPVARKAWFDAKVAEAYQQNKALSSVTYLEFDDVIDPAQTRREIAQTLFMLPARPRPAGKKRSMVDAW